MRTLKQQILQNIEEKLTLFPAASPASLSAQQAKERERKTTATSGRKCYELYERCNRHGWWLKTLVGCLLNSEAWYSSACVLTWKVKGTKYNRLLFQLAPSMRHTAGTEFGLLPTAQTQGLKVCNRSGKTEFLNLKLLPIPTGMMPGDVDLDKREARMEKLKASGV